MNATLRTSETDAAVEDPYAVLTAPDTLTLHRRLPGPVDRVWACLTEGELRRRWLASGEMEMRAGAPFDLIWRNDELTTPAGVRPEGFRSSHTSQNQVLAVETNRHLSIAFGGAGEVTFDLEPDGEDVLLTLVHRGIPGHAMMQIIAPSWHNHLDLLVDLVAGRTPREPYWDKMARLLKDYQALLPA
jgi:uncharacterized protein YndB with AHSA1/START domain